MNLKKLKRRIIELSYKHKLSHIGSCLSVLPIIADKYEKMNKEDKLIISAGHSHLAHLVVMEEMGIIKDAESNLVSYGIHCDRRAGCSVSTGSLGHGIGIALGMALADRNRTVYCICTDGELAEGSVWEAFRIQKEQNVDNLLITVNVNGWGALGKIKQSELINRIEACSWARCVEPVYPIEYDFPFLAGLQGHYHALTEEEYKASMLALQ